MKLKLIFTIILICFGIYGFSEEYSDTVKPELVYDTSLLESNNIIRVGVLYKLKPHWHIYWKNSGDSGLPTKIKFILPDGFEAGDINWPIPNAYKRSGDILDYGYEDQVLLWSDVKVPYDYKKISDIQVGIKTKWVSCEEICIPGKAEFTENIDLKHKIKLFNIWSPNLPANKNNNFDIKVVSSDNNYEIIINNKGLGNDFKLFPNPGKAIDIESISYKDNGNNRSDILFTVTIYPGHEVNTNKIDTVISYVDKENTRKGFNYSINIEDLIVKN